MAADTGTEARAESSPDCVDTPVDRFKKWSDLRSTPECMPKSMRDRFDAMYDWIAGSGTDTRGLILILLCGMRLTVVLADLANVLAGVEEMGAGVDGAGGGAFRLVELVVLLLLLMAVTVVVVVVVVVSAAVAVVGGTAEPMSASAGAEVEASEGGVVSAGDASVLTKAEAGRRACCSRSACDL
jgi:hypothetical protein